MSSRRKVMVVAGSLIALGLAAPYTDSFVILLITRALILGILAMSLDILLGFTGLASLGQAAYFGFVVASLAILYILVKSPFGRSLEGIREREVRMRILGYNTWLHKYIAFIIAGAFGGLSGVLWAHANGHVSPEDVVLTTSVDALLMVVLGGSGTLVGGAVGAALVVFLREYLSTLVPWWQYVLGGVYILTILFLPTGLMGIPERIRRRRALSGSRKAIKNIAPAAS